MTGARRERFRWAQVVLGLLGVAVLVFLVRRAGETAVRSALDDVRPLYLVLDVGIVALIFVGFALRWRYLLRGLGLEVGLGTVLGARVAGLAVGTLTPGAKLGGEPLRAYLLGRRGVPLGPAIATVVVDRGIELLANVVFAMVYCALFAMRDVGAAGRVFAVVAAVGVGLTFGVRVALQRLESGRSLVPVRFRSVLERLGAAEATLADVDRSLHELVFRHRRRVLVGLGWALVLNAVIFLDYLTLFAAFGPVPSLPDLAGSMLGVGFAHALPVPASIGALEGAQAAVFELAGDSHGAIVAAAAVRLRDILWTLPGLIYLAVLALRRRLT